MFRFNHILLIKMVLPICLSFILEKELLGQTWIIDTPTGKLSAWIIQRHQTQPQKAELFLLNQTGQTVFLDDYNTNNNYLEIISPSGLKVITRKKVFGQKLTLKNNPSSEDIQKWEVDFFDYLQNLDFKERGYYSITWHLNTSKGLLSAEPVKVFFESRKH